MDGLLEYAVAGDDGVASIRLIAPIGWTDAWEPQGESEKTFCPLLSQCQIFAGADACDTNGVAWIGMEAASTLIGVACVELVVPDVTLGLCTGTSEPLDSAITTGMAITTTTPAKIHGNKSVCARCDMDVILQEALRRQ